MEVYSAGGSPRSDATYRGSAMATGCSDFLTQHFVVRQCITYVRMLNFPETACQGWMHHTNNLYRKCNRGTTVCQLWCEMQWLVVRGIAAPSRRHLVLPLSVEKSTFDVGQAEVECMLSTGPLFYGRRCCRIASGLARVFQSLTECQINAIFASGIMVAL